MLIHGISEGSCDVFVFSMDEDYFWMDIVFVFKVGVVFLETPFINDKETSANALESL